MLGTGTPGMSSTPGHAGARHAGARHASAGWAEGAEVPGGRCAARGLTRCRGQPTRRGLNSEPARRTGRAGCAGVPSGVGAVARRTALAAPEPVARGLPDPARADTRPPAHLARQRRHHAQAATGHRPSHALLRTRELQRAPGGTHARGSIHRRLRTVRTKVADYGAQLRHHRPASGPQRTASDEIVWVRGTTEAINLVANAWGRNNVGAGDEVLITWLEHHANLVRCRCRATRRARL